MSGIEIKRNCGYTGSNRGFALALMRMMDKGLIDCHDPIANTFVTTPAGLGAFLDVKLREIVQ